MGDVQAWLPAQFPSQPSNPHPMAIRADSWHQAEQSAQEILRRIQPTALSEERRKAVVDYVQRVVRRNLGSEVFPFGSVPLKTYLPDGDIDLTALSNPNPDGDSASEVCSILKSEEQDKDAEFEVKDVQIINAEVKLVKCLVQNIVVDISFNQIGGLSTLCFLEQVDRYIGKDHLFKRSIILIKDWCYYESRILGAHHGLISTYALETLVLYIFHLFHSSLDGPLAVLYRFLDYFSKFNWDNYCISIHGPVSIYSLPELVAEAPENDGGDLLLSKEFLRSSVEMFSVPLRVSENISQAFPLKHLNIIDPLKDNNNLGRSVSKGNFFRIRSAFSFGARKLGGILSSPREQIADELNLFFLNTLDQHGSGERPDIGDSYFSCGSGSTLLDQNKFRSTLDVKAERGREDSLNPRPSNTVSDGAELDKYTETEFYDLTEGNIFSSRCSVGDARDLASGLRIEDESYKASASNSHVGFYKTGLSSSTNPRFSGSNGTSSSNAYHSEIPHHGDCSLGDGTNGSLTPFNLSDLTGDYDLHFRCLLFAQYSLELSGGIVPPTLQSPSSQFHNGQSWVALRRQSMLVHLGANGVGPGLPSPPVSFTLTSPYVSGAHGSEDTLRQRGTGTYIPNMNYQPYRERLSPKRTSSTLPFSQPPRARNNGRVETPAEMNSNFLERGSSHDPSSPVPEAQVPVLGGNGKGKTALSDIPQPSRPAWRGVPQANNFVMPQGSSLQFRSFSAVASGAFSPKFSRRLDSIGPFSQGSSGLLHASTVQRPGMTLTPKRHYQLKDNFDFPPLSG